MKNIDPIKQLQAKLAHPKTNQAHKEINLAAAFVEDELPYEIALAPKPGDKVMQLTIGSTYRSNPIPVLFDPQLRVTYPIIASKK